MEAEQIAEIFAGMVELIEALKELEDVLDTLSGVGDVDIDIPESQAAQPIGIAKDSRFPNLTQRLIDRLRSEASRQRFEDLGFRWDADTAPATNDGASAEGVE